VVCDVDPRHEDAESVSFGYDNHFYEADLCEDDAERLSEALAPFISVAREVAAKEAARRALSGATADYDPQVVKTWLVANGHTVSDRGRIPESLVAIYNNAHS
jgi:hypothetical protein